MRTLILKKPPESLFVVWNARDDEFLFNAETQTHVFWSRRQALDAITEYLDEPYGHDLTAGRVYTERLDGMTGESFTLFAYNEEVP